MRLLDCSARGRAVRQIPTGVSDLYCHRSGSPVDGAWLGGAVQMQRASLRERPPGSPV